MIDKKLVSCRSHGSTDKIWESYMIVIMRQRRLTGFFERFSANKRSLVVRAKFMRLDENSFLFPTIMAGIVITLEKSE